MSGSLDVHSVPKCPPPHTYWHCDHLVPYGRWVFTQTVNYVQVKGQTAQIHTLPRNRYVH